MVTALQIATMIVRLATSMRTAFAMLEFVGTVDVLGCNGECFYNLDNDFICDDIDNCTDLYACNLMDPQTAAGYRLARCTDASASNYNENAAYDDGPCEYVVEGRDGQQCLQLC